MTKQEDALLKRVADEVREAVLGALASAGLLTRPDEPMNGEPETDGPGLPVVFVCGCGRPGCPSVLKVSPIIIDGIRCVDLIPTVPMYGGGVVLSPEDRAMLVDILADTDWFGDRADLR
jgi:hypothetical protein